jgi:hypothetical protein
MRTNLCFLSTEHITRTVGQETFEFNIAEADKSDDIHRIVPVAISLPNIFENVNSFRNKFVDSGGTRTIPVNQYTTTTLATALSAASVDFNMTVNSDGKFVLTCTGTKTMNTTANDTPNELFELLGFQDDLLSEGILEVTTSQIASKLPNLGGEKLVFIRAPELAAGNMINGDDRNSSDILTQISFHDVGFGFEGHVKAADMMVDDVEYKVPQSFSMLRVEILDSKFRRLTLPNNYHLRLILKFIHFG